MRTKPIDTTQTAPSIQQGPRPPSEKPLLQKIWGLFFAKQEASSRCDPVWVQALSHRTQVIKCSLNDHFSSRTTVPVVFVYRAHIPKDLILGALQAVLSDFPVFAGKLVKQSDHLYIDCNNQGVRVTTVHFRDPLPKDISDPTKIDFTPFVDVLDASKALKQKQPLLTIQLNYHPDGMVIGYCWNHSVGDMATFISLLKAMSAFAQGTNYEAGLVVEDRDAYLHQYLNKEPCTLKQEDSLKYLGVMDIFRVIQHLRAPKQNVHLHFTPEEIEELKHTLEAKTGTKLSRNDVVCAHILGILSQCHNTSGKETQASLIVNTRPRMGMPTNLLGNFVDFIPIKTTKPGAVELTAMTIHSAVQNYLVESSHQLETEGFIHKHGGIKSINRILPKMFSPQSKNLVITNWSNFGAYSIDFGMSKPELFLPIGKAPFPWLACIVEGAENKGLSVFLALPPAVAGNLMQPAMLQQVHQHRTSPSI